MVIMKKLFKRLLSKELLTCATTMGLLKQTTTTMTKKHYLRLNEYLLKKDIFLLTDKNIFQSQKP